MQEHKSLYILLYEEHKTFGLILPENLKNNEMLKFPKPKNRWSLNWILLFQKNSVYGNYCSYQCGFLAPQGFAEDNTVSVFQVSF